MLEVRTGFGARGRSWLRLCNVALSTVSSAALAAWRCTCTGGALDAVPLLLGYAGEKMNWRPGGGASHATGS